MDSYGQVNNNPPKIGDIINYEDMKSPALYCERYSISVSPNTTSNLTSVSSSTRTTITIPIEADPSVFLVPDNAYLRFSVSISVYQ